MNAIIGVNKSKQLRAQTCIFFRNISKIYTVPKRLKKKSG